MKFLKNLKDKKEKIVIFFSMLFVMTFVSNPFLHQAYANNVATGTSIGDKVVNTIKTVVIAMIVIFALIGILKEIKGLSSGNGSIGKILGIAGTAVFLAVIVIFISGGLLKSSSETIGDKMKSNLQTDINGLDIAK